MVFAAGFGTRMGALTKDRPKPLIEVAGKPLLDHALDLARPLGLSRTIVNTHYLSHMIADHLEGQNIGVINEAPDILETGGGLKNAAAMLGDGPAFTLNSDAVWHGPNPLQGLAAAWQPEKMDALLLLLPKANALGHKGKGDFLMAEDGSLSRGAGLVYSGAQIIRPELATENEDKAFSLNVIWDNLIQSGRLFGTLYSGAWCDVGSPEGISRAESMLTS